MRRDSWFKSTVFSVLVSGAVVCFSGAASVRAQQPDATKFNQTFEAIYAKAHADCQAHWADHAFDPWRDKIPFGDEKPTFSMLKNSERLRPKDRPIVDLAVKMLELCRTAYAPAFAMLPPQVNAMIQGLQRRQDALIAELYVGKITFGEYNIDMDRMNGEFARVISGIPLTPHTASSPAMSEEKSAAASEAVSTPRSRPTEVNPAPKATVSHEVRVALVIGDSSHLNLPRLANPENDARAIADLLNKIGFSTRLVLNSSEQDLRREVLRFPGESDKADIALVFCAGHGAQVNGENYVLPVDIDIPRTESDIQLTGLKVDDLVNSKKAKTWAALLDLREEDWDRTIRTNLKGTFLCTQHAARAMRGRGGSIVNISSGSSAHPFPNLSNYCASKGGIRNLTVVAAVELGPLRIRVNCVAPGAIEIERTRRESPDYAGTWARLTPLGRVGQVQDVADAVVFLASDAARFVTGQTLYVDGGLFSQVPWPYGPNR